MYCTEHNIRGELLTGIGAADELKIAYYHLPTKTYERKKISEEVEIVSLTGNVGILEGKTVLHIHGVFGKRDLSTFGVIYSNYEYQEHANCSLFHYPLLSIEHMMRRQDLIYLQLYRV